MMTNELIIAATVPLGIAIALMGVGDYIERNWASLTMGWFDTIDKMYRRRNDFSNLVNGLVGLTLLYWILNLIFG